MRLNYTLAFPIIIILIIVAGTSLIIGYYLNMSTLKNVIEDREIARVMAINDAVNDKINTYIREINAASHLFKKNSLLIDSLVSFQQQGNLGPLKKTIDALYPTLLPMQLDFLLVINQHGKIMYHPPGRVYKGDVSRVWGMEEALAGKDTLSAGVSPLGWGIMSLVPLADRSKQYGVLLLGIPLDDAFARSVASATHAQITFSTAYQILASSWQAAASQWVDLSRATDSIMGKRPLYFFDTQTNFSSFYIPLKIVDETVCLIIQIDNTRVAALFHKKEGELALSSAGVLLFMLAVGWGLTYAIVRPLRKLQQSAVKVIKEFSEEDVPLPRGGTEIATLSHAMELMLATIHKHISDLERIQANLWEEKLFFASVFKSIQDGIAVVDSDFTIIQVNPALEQLFRHRLPLVGQKCYAAIHGAGQPCDDCPGREAMATGQASSHCKSFSHGKGESPTWLEIHAFPFHKTADGQAAGVIEYIRDITWQKAVEESLRRQEDRLRQAAKMEAIGTLAGGIAHDFNNILGAILGFTELTMLSVPEGSKEHYNLDQVLKAGERARDLVKQILVFGRRAAQEKSPLPIRAVVQETLKLLRASLPSTINIKENLAAPAALVLADPTQVHQILMNLGANAAHAMRENGGLLEINLEAVSLGQGDLLQHPGLTPGPYVQLTVRDTGQGMAPEIVERIFDPFFTTKAVGEGTGMGLAVVHGIVQSIGGEILVASQPGAGTTFTILLPEAAGAADSTEATLGPLPTGSHSILFIDDEEMLVKIIQVMLKKLGYQVVAQTSSLEAAKIFQAQPEKFDLVITDQTMPHKTGMQLAQEFRLLRPDIPIILCTGYSETVTVEDIKAAGINELLMKPFPMRNLAETIRKILH